MPIDDPSMEKKNSGKLAALGKCNLEPKPKLNPEYNASPRNGRGRRPQPVGRPAPQRYRQGVDRRPRERGQAASGAEHSHREQVAHAAEASSVFSKGSKKGYLDASYLVNFRCEAARDAHAERYSSSQWHQQRSNQQHERPHWPASRVFRPRHVKEQYLQARCQLLVRDDANYAANLGDPDRLVDWACVEQVWLREEEPTTCPICLYPPTVPRITRCGHTYCCACLLHYLALSDQASRKCPICEEPVHPDQVRRCRLLARTPARLGDTVTFRLMRRQRLSLLGQPADEQQPWEEIITLADPESKLRLAKLIMVSPEQVTSEILAPERAALERQLAELRHEPEACFVEQALSQLAEQEVVMAERAAASRARPQRPDPATARELVTPLPTAAAADTVVYQSAFDERTVEQVEAEAEAQAPAVSPPPPAGDGSVRQRSVSEASGGEVTVADLEVPAAEPRRDDHDQPLYYYQAEGGDPVYLHALNCRMLLEEHGTWERCPRRLTAQLVDVDAVTMTAGFRQRLRSLRHLPLTAQLQVVEVRLRPPDVSADTVSLFRDQIRKREQRRRDKHRRERQHERRLRQDERRARPADAVYDAAFPVAEQRPPSPPPPLLSEPAVEEPTELGEAAA
ncbi:RING finger protein 10-like, partial [Pollicipes pollicipes]|uniref:RING finger protein 10-like n=1 Tax=Pollicipes pollicipes TaxID=41117 RepID=UPI0018850848